MVRFAPLARRHPLPPDARDRPKQTVYQAITRLPTLRIGRLLTV
jgi:hypothetical protein